MVDRSSLMRTIGNNVRDFRKQRGLTQEQLAEKVGISTSFCANIERGSKGASLCVLKEIADTLEVSVDRLLSEEEESDALEDVVSLLRGKPRYVIAAVEQIVRACLRGFCGED